MTVDENKVHVPDEIVGVRVHYIILMYSRYQLYIL